MRQPSLPQIPNDRLETIEGVVERVTFASEETGFTVAKLNVSGRKDLLPIVGPMLSLTPGETLSVTGFFQQSSSYGLQFKVINYKSKVPSSIHGIKAYLKSGCVKGVGPVYAGKIVDAFGEATFDVIEQTPERLLEIRGVGTKRVQGITAAWSETKEIRHVLSFLTQYKISSGFAVKVYKAYGNGAIAVVKNNPYRLAQDIRGIGFLKSDALAREMGIPEDSPLRATAAVLYKLQLLTDQGHVFLPTAPLFAAVEKDLRVPVHQLQPGLVELDQSGKVVVEETPHGTVVYLKPLHLAETKAAQRLLHVLRAPRHFPAIDAEKALPWAEGRSGITLTPEQRRAVAMALREKCAIITGGPGTGKTTILNTLVQILVAKQARVALASPTGRAAKRLSEVTGQPASTLHRLLEFGPQGKFMRNKQNPLETDILIIDECSMVDIMLFYHVLQALPLTATLVLVGDADQLPSVGPGTVFRDLLDFDPIPQTRLTTVFRQAEESQIIRNAHRINAGVQPVTIAEEGSRRDFFLMEEEDPLALQKTLVEVVTKRLPEKYGWDPFEDIQVLTPMHRGPIGTAQLNAELQKVLNPPATSKAELLRGGRFYRVGDKILSQKNNYDLQTMNGSMGRILAIDPEEQVVRVRIEDREVAYPYSNLDELAHAYALSVHKSQGAEFKCCVLVCHTTFYIMLQRNLLYTGVTRARELCVILGTKQAIGISVRNQSPNHRNSGLTERLRALATGPLLPEAAPETNGETLRLDLPNEGLDLPDDETDRK